MSGSYCKKHEVDFGGEYFCYKCVEEERTELAELRRLKSRYAKCEKHRTDLFNGNLCQHCVAEGYVERDTQRQALADRLREADTRRGVLNDELVQTAHNYQTLLNKYDRITTEKNNTYETARLFTDRLLEADELLDKAGIPQGELLPKRLGQYIEQQKRQKVLQKQQYETNLADLESRRAELWEKHDRLKRAWDRDVKKGREFFDANVALTGAINKTLDILDPSIGVMALVSSIGISLRAGLVAAEKAMGVLPKPEPAKTEPDEWKQQIERRLDALEGRKVLGICADCNWDGACAEQTRHGQRGCPGFNPKG